MRNGDFHVHTQYCPHGSKDTMEAYILRAIEKGLESLTFTEHAPLPDSFVDPVPNQDSAMSWTDVDAYLADGEKLKQKYKDDIHIKIGFEVDYIEGFEKETKNILNYFGSKIEDSILSVHMLRINDEYVCIDYSVDEFERILSLSNGIDSLYTLYYNTLKQSILADLGTYKPRRIGHMTLIEKFRKRFPTATDFSSLQKEILLLIQQEHLELDVNTAGFFKDWNENCYPPQQLIYKAKELGIPLVPGSDSHTAKHIARGFNRITI
ncbi:histidinol-phosphatase HisJ [Radiobacillus deserti]|nr:histidinol-phosphatase HisJ [Radiobacillus deserti]